ncbi:kinase-like domain-containing protein [Catenaria anguillulae PL171]|uniref:non-specific serine/threonine protein kinase n=1 Tax=Catenaria anguillulae PL171 TaxID=765915 RepID=A0A1Y2HHM4_9FUNG|nr:kinase-like domain-containing protein [Catenaria anguillulae PL171]
MAATSRRPALSHAASAPPGGTSAFSAPSAPASASTSAAADSVPLGTPTTSLHGDERKKYERRASAAIEAFRLISAWPQLESMYKIMGKVGEGSFSIVYKAIDLRQDKLQTVRGLHSKYVAIKHVHPSAGSERILSEVRLLAELRGHPNVASLVDLHRFEHHILLIMPYWNHMQWNDYFRVLPVPEFRFYFSCLFAALKFCHEKGIIHRDVKPNNFIYDPRRRHGVLVDFGLAQHYHPPAKKSARSAPLSQSLRPLSTSAADLLDPTGSSNSHYTNPELLLGAHQPAELLHDQRRAIDANRAGTRGFRAPEVLFKVQNQTPVVDVWSAGVTLLSFMTRKFPFFPSDNDTFALQEIAVIFGSRAIRSLASKFDRIFLSTLPNIPKDGVPLRDLVYSLNQREFFEMPTEALDFLNKCLTLDPNKRMTADQAVNHVYLRGVSSLGCEPVEEE